MKLTDAPRFSIVIPTYNRPEQLAVCLQACARLDYPRDCFEVIVVDDGGVEPLDGIVARFHGTLTLKLLQQENTGPAAARNRGASEASGEFLAFTDDDCSPASDWLKALGRHCVASPDCVVGGANGQRAHGECLLHGQPATDLLSVFVLQRDFSQCAIFPVE